MCNAHISMLVWKCTRHIQELYLPGTKDFATANRPRVPLRWYKGTVCKECNWYIDAQVCMLVWNFTKYIRDLQFSGRLEAASSHRIRDFDVVCQAPALCSFALHAFCYYASGEEIPFESFTMLWACTYWVVKIKLENVCKKREQTGDVSVAMFD